MNVNGLAQGMGLFHVTARVLTATTDGYQGSRDVPTFYTVGGNPIDAFRNAVVLLNRSIGDIIEKHTSNRRVVKTTVADVVLTITDADPDSTTPTITYRLSAMHA